MHQVIQRATFDDFENIVNLVKDCVYGNSRNKADRKRWAFPNPSVIVQDLWRGHMFKLTVDGKLAGVVAFNSKGEDSWKEVNWRHREPDTLVVHRLAVRPEQQGRGLATQLMLFVEDYARDKNYGAIRLDVYCRNQAAVALYEKLGYDRAGEVTYGNKQNSFFCFEKVLETVDEPILAW